MTEGAQVDNNDEETDEARFERYVSMYDVRTLARMAIEAEAGYSKLYDALQNIFCRTAGRKAPLAKRIASIADDAMNGDGT